MTRAEILFNTFLHAFVFLVKCYAGAYFAHIGWAQFK